MLMAPVTKHRNEMGACRLLDDAMSAWGDEAVQHQSAEYGTGHTQWGSTGPFRLCMFPIMETKQSRGTSIMFVFLCFIAQCIQIGEGLGCRQGENVVLP